jgi:hypothetical protein
MQHLLLVDIVQNFASKYLELTTDLVASWQASKTSSNRRQMWRADVCMQNKQRKWSTGEFSTHRGNTGFKNIIPLLLVEYRDIKVLESTKPLHSHEDDTR